MKDKTITMSKKEYQRLKTQANINLEIFEQLIESFRDIEAGRIRRIR